MPITAPRVVGVDVARGLAILGMFVAHAAPNPSDAELFADGRSSILFATLAGVSLGIMTGAANPAPRGARSDRLQRIVLRALILFVLGIALSVLGSGIAIILQYYAVMFLLLTPLMFLRRTMLAVIGAILVFAAPALAGAVGEPRLSGAGLAYLAQDLVLSGYYPALIWLPFLIAGLICSRSDLTAARTQLLMIAGGAAASLLGYGAALVLPGVTAEAHSGSTAEVLGSGGLAIAVIGVLLWVTSAERGGLGRVIRTVTWPIAATGSMALTVYTLQILALAIAAAVRDSSGAIDYPGWPLLIGLIVASIVFSVLWRRFLGRGPLEQILGAMTDFRATAGQRTQPERARTTGADGEDRRPPPG